ncbi:flap endonuclease [Nakamurella flavida]|uniref:5'-3' exonuclease n=1 Tax=Nakamurella flavida TaxID=363630 RepID=A0A938YCY7_9ACTN|nr:5'-3' exonuclease H3TH domain-containing protein [Nakamurella flavida]MBM9475370.1 flap endonuclease [Nakamurella flavida]MDP9776950.1 5'-3' exonuclease [Nakamurella flavida]
MLQLLDLAGIYFRAFHSSPASVTAPDGRPVNAVRGTLEIVRRVLHDGQPTRVIACLDLDWRPQWRVDLVPSYKTHRVAGATPANTGNVAPLDLSVGGLHPEPDRIEEVPDLLGPQVPVLLEVLAAIGITIAGALECEADDVIGTLAATETRDEVEVVTGDRDLFQVARPGPPEVRVRYIGAGMSKVVVHTAQSVAEKYDIPPGHYPAFAALRGDPSDGLPGVPGVGDKTAASLVRAYGGVPEILAAVDDPTSGLGAGPRAKLAAARDYLTVAPRVVAVRTDAAITVDPAGDGTLPTEPAHPQALIDLVEQWGIGNPVKRLLDEIAALQR